jgi:hypothetical protein
MRAKKRFLSLPLRTVIAHCLWPADEPNPTPGDRLQRRSATFLTEGLVSENAVKLGKYKITEKDFGISFRDWNAAKEQAREAMIARGR